MRLFSLLVLWFAGLGFLAFGAGFVAAPAKLAASADLAALSAAGLVELRAFYGGAELALGMLLIACALKAGRRRDGLLLAALSYGAVGGTRALSMLVGAADSPFLRMALIIELGTALAAIIALRAAVNRSG